MAEMAASVATKAATAAERGDMPAHVVGAEDIMRDGETHKGGGAHTWPTSSNFTSRRKRDKKQSTGELCNEDSHESLEEYEYRQRTTPISSTRLDVENDDLRNNTASASLHLGGDQRLGSSSLPTRLDKDTSRTLPLTSSSAVVRKGKRKRFSTLLNREGNGLCKDTEDEIQDDDDMPSERPSVPSPAPRPPPRSQQPQHMECPLAEGAEPGVRRSRRIRQANRRIYNDNYDYTGIPEQDGHGQGPSRMPGGGVCGDQKGDQGQGGGNGKGRGPAQGLGPQQGDPKAPNTPAVYESNKDEVAINNGRRITRMATETPNFDPVKFTLERAQLEREAKQGKEKFLIFMRVLMKYLEQKDPAMHSKAKAVIKEVAERNKAGGAAYADLTNGMQPRLRQTVGEAHWKKAEDYLNHYQKQLLKQQAAKQQLLKQQATNAVTAGRKTMREAIETPNSIPKPIPIDYIKKATEDFLDERKLGEGSFSMVFVGKDHVLRRKFAVKQMKLKFHDKTSLTEAKKTFEKEIATLKHFHHPNIARLYAYCFDRGLHRPHCLVYELASLGSLEQILRIESQKGRLDWTKRISITLGIASALEYMHGGKGGQICFHRDVKSSNICLRRDYTALLIDCGVAKMIPLDDSKATMTVMESAGNGLRGTPGYICPDYLFHVCMKGGNYKYSSANDVFSFGVVMSEIFTGVLQNSLKDGESINMYQRYIGGRRNMQRDIDKSAKDWDLLAKRNFPKLAVDAMKPKPEERPPIGEIVERLSKLDAKARPRSPGEQNSITVLVSSPLVYVEDGDEKPMIDALHFSLERDLLEASIKLSKRDIQLASDAATIDRLQIAATKRCGCLHFSGHGYRDKLLFEDGRGGAHWLTEKDVKDCVHREPFTLVFISACHSEYMGKAFGDAGVKHVVCCKYDEKLSDEAAIKFTHYFYLALAEGGTIQNAFEKGKDATHNCSVEEANKFLLLPQGGNHDVQVFHAEELEWDEGTSPAASIPPVPEHFVDREVDMYHVLQLVLDHRLVNLVGDHGVGCSSLASAVSHYINERRSTILSIESIYFLRGHDQYSDMLEKLRGQLANEGRTQCLPGGDDSLLVEGLVSALSGVKALVVLDDITVEDSVLMEFSARLLEASSSTRLLILTRKEVNFTSPYAKRKVYKLAPLNAVPT